MTDQEISRIVTAIAEIAYHYDNWRYDYHYNPCTNEWAHIHEQSVRAHSLKVVQEMFQL
ncbi:hypothetical protein D3C76_1771370 [compost metagenome]